MELTRTIHHISGKTRWQVRIAVQVRPAEVHALDNGGIVSLEGTGDDRVREERKVATNTDGCTRVPAHAATHLRDAQKCLKLELGENAERLISPDGIHDEPTK